MSKQLPDAFDEQRTFRNRNLRADREPYPKKPQFSHDLGGSIPSDAIRDDFTDSYVRYGRSPTIKSETLVRNETDGEMECAVTGKPYMKEIRSYRSNIAYYFVFNIEIYTYLSYTSTYTSSRLKRPSNARFSS
ncbi:hypothetical protein Trydic_g4997 [Trypoxylus dichotomus]